MFIVCTLLHFWCLDDEVYTYHKTYTILTTIIQMHRKSNNPDPIPSNIAKTLLKYFSALPNLKKINKVNTSWLPKYKKGPSNWFKLSNPLSTPARMVVSSRILYIDFLFCSWWVGLVKTWYYGGYFISCWGVGLWVIRFLVGLLVVMRFVV